MAKTPFHRRVLPWLFAIIFFIMAPAVVFYTAGYRWNPKKNVIERNGTLIIDTQPSGASISLNGKAIPQKTPVTLQNMSPGSYEISLNLAGYYPWTKNLAIDPEMVTFATDITLWPQSEPQLVAASGFKRLISDPDSGQLLAVSPGDGDSTVFALLDEKTGQKIKEVTAKEPIDVWSADWNPHDDKQILIHGQSSSTSGYWLVQFSSPAATRLPEGEYHWEADGLVGYAPTYRLTVRNDLSVVRDNKPPERTDSLDNWLLNRTASNDNLILLENSNAKQGLIMPQGDWRFWSSDRDSLIFRDQNRWLWMEAKQNPSFSHQASGDWLLPLTIKRQLRFVFKHDNEAWVWKYDADPELVYRQSDPLVSVAWHPNGLDMMVATKNDIIMFSLDDRSGREKTILASFDEIKDATIAGDTVYVSGTRKGQTGLWKIPLALKSSGFLPLSRLGL